MVYREAPHEGDDLKEGVLTSAVVIAGVFVVVEVAARLLPVDRVSDRDDPVCLLLWVANRATTSGTDSCAKRTAAPCTYDRVAAEWIVGDCSCPCKELCFR
jgi:hypothetical protein